MSHDKDEILIQRFFEEIQASDECSQESPLPSAEFLLWRSRIAEKQRRSRRALAGIQTVQIVALAAAVLLAAVFSALWLPALLGTRATPLIAAVLMIAFCGVILLVWSRRTHWRHE